MAQLAYLAMDLFKKKLTAFSRISSYSPDEDHKGQYVNQDSADFEFWGVIQPVSRAVLLSLEEGQRANVQYQLHTSEKLSMGVKTFETSSDTYVRHNGKVFKVVEVSEFDQWGFRTYALQNSEIEQGK